MKKKKQKYQLFIDEDILLHIHERAPLELSNEVQQNLIEHESVTPKEKEETPKTKMFSKKTLWTILFILVNAIAILITALIDVSSDQEKIPFSEVFKIMLENFEWGLYALAVFFLAVLFKGLKRYALLRASLKRRGLFKVGLSSSIVCKYYDCVTPLGSGGQPVEIYYLKKKGVPGAIASGVSITSYSLEQFAAMSLAIGLLLWQGFMGVSPVIKAMAIIGICFNTFLPLGVLTFSISPKFGDWVASVVTKFLKWIKIVKNPQVFEEKAVKSMREYAKCIIYFFGKYSIATILGFVCAFGYSLAIFSLPYLVMRFCGVSSAVINYGEILTLCVICTCAVTFIPTPGNSGAAEISFYSIFSTYLAGGILFWGVLSWRLVAYYMFLVVGIVLMIIEKIVSVLAEKKKLKQEIKT